MLTFVEMPNAPIRSIKAKVELYNSSSTLLNTFRYSDNLIGVDIDRVGEESKFFGFGIIQKATIQLRDTERAINPKEGDYFLYYIGATEEEIDLNMNQPYYPAFYISEVKRDENTNNLTITCYDKLEAAAKHTVEEIGLTEAYSLDTVVGMAASKLGLTLEYNEAITAFNLYYETGANLSGTETLKSIFDSAAEVTQTIYFVKGNTLQYKRLDFSGEAVLEIGKANYIELTSEAPRKLAAISHTTELGDNLLATTGEDGETQYIRNNPFLELREDAATLLENFVAAVGGAIITPFTCSWRGNYLLEIGDKIALVTKDNDIIYSFVINDSMSYNGGFSQNTSWTYEASSAETANNPTTLGDIIKDTYAKVDKANQKIEIVASEAGANKAAIASLQLDTESIGASVKSVKDTTEQALSGVNSSLETLTEKVTATMTSEEIAILISSEIANGTTKVTTATGFVFDENGLTVDKSGSEMKTQITEDGMKVYRDNTEVLTADNVGVKARNLHAETYLIIGTNSRFENYGSNRTGCFWIGG